MSPILVLLIVFMVTLIIGVPFVWSLTISCLASLCLMNGFPVMTMVQKMYNGGARYTLLAIFFFMLAGSIMQHGGISSRLVEFSKENTSDGVLLKTVKKKEIEEIAGSSSSSISGSWQQTVRFPDSAGGQYRLSFQYHSVQTGKYGMSGFIVLSFKSGKNVKTEVKTFSVGRKVFLTKNKTFLYFSADCRKLPKNKERKTNDRS